MENNPQPLAFTHVWSAAPNAVKLRINRNLMRLGDTRRYDSPAATGDSPLARALFAIKGVITVELEGAAVTVVMDDNSDWDAIMERVPGVITEQFESGEPAVKTETPSAGAKRHKFGFKQVETRSRDEQMEIVKNLLDQEINPAVAAHGGFFTLLDVKDNNVYVQLGGGCQGCGMADVTLKQGVEQRMREVLPEMASLIDTTDHAAGSNPYYSPGK